jgi:predicted nucleic acid-binding protein
MAFAVVLDADVLFRLPVCDTLLRLAEIELYGPYWSERILDELARNLVESGRTTEEAAQRRVRLMSEAFEAAEVSEAAIATLEPSMENDPKDRHVLAAAVAVGAQVIAASAGKWYPARLQISKPRTHGRKTGTRSARLHRVRTEGTAGQALLARQDEWAVLTTHYLFEAIPIGLGGGPGTPT